jgi:proteasome lid subunit RPN8/RPN11
MARYRFFMEFLRADGTRLAHLPIGERHDLFSPAVEWTTFLGIRRGTLAAETGARVVIEPCWDHGLGAPYVSGFRATVSGGGGATAACEFPTAYFGGFAREAAADLVREHLLEPGDRYRFRLAAYLDARTDPPADRNEISVEEIPCPLPLETTALGPFVADAGLQAADVAGDDVPVFVPRHVIEEALERSRRAGGVEVGGVLVGKLHRDPASGEVFVEITAQVPARHTRERATSLTFTAETWAAVGAAIKLRDQRELAVGWWHFHPDFCAKCPAEARARCTMRSVFFSEEDVRLHRVCFGRAYQVALLVSDLGDGLAWSAFGWRDGMVVARSFGVTGRPAGAARGDTPAAPSWTGEAQHDDPRSTLQQEANHGERA